MNYLAGETIELTFAKGELDVAQVTGLRRGLYLDPAVPPPTGETQPTSTPRPPGGTSPENGNEETDAR